MIAATWIAAAVIAIGDVRHPAIDGPAVLGQPRAAVMRAFAENGWRHEPARSTKGTATFGHDGVHLDVTVTFGADGRARSAKVRPWHDEASNAFVAQHYKGLLAWLMGAQPRALRKTFAEGDLTELEIGR